MVLGTVDIMRKTTAQLRMTDSNGKSVEHPSAVIDAVLAGDTSPKDYCVALERIATSDTVGCATEPDPRRRSD